MGMFDYFRSSMNIGELTDIECQTKDIEEYAGGTLSFYWVDPIGALWFIDYAGTADFIAVEDESLPIWLQYKNVPNGNRGRVTRSNLTKKLVIYTSQTSPDGHLEWTECVVTFVDGLLKEFTYINNCI